MCERLQCLDYYGFDVVVDCVECRKDWYILGAVPGVKEYVAGDAYICINVGASVDFNKLYRRTASAGTARSCCKEVGTIAGTQGVFSDVSCDDSESDLPVLIPVVHAIENGEWVSFEIMPSWIWKCSDDFALDAFRDRSETPVAEFDGVLSRYWKHQGAFVLSRKRSGGFGDTKDNVVQAVAKTVERISDDQWKFNRKFMENLCEEVGAFFGILLFGDSVGVFTPFSKESIRVGDMVFGSRKLEFITEHCDKAQ